MPIPSLSTNPAVVIRILAEDMTRGVRDGIKKNFGTLGADLSKSLTEGIGGAFTGIAIVMGVRQVLTKAFQQADELAQSQRTLAATATLAGVALEDLQRVSAGVSEQFGLDNDVANQFTETVTRLTSRAGMLNKTTEATAAFLNLGAARGYTATQTMEALENAFVGVYRGAQRVLGTNVQEVFEKYAASVGKSVAALTEDEKAQALVNAALERGAKVGNAYNEFLESTAGRTEQWRIAQDNLAESIGLALDPARRLALTFATDIVHALTETVVGIQQLSAEFGAFFFSIPARAKIAAGLVLEALATIVDKGQGLLRALGFDVGYNLGRSMHEASQRLVSEGTATLANFRTVIEETAQELAGVLNGSTRRSSLQQRNLNHGGAGRPPSREEQEAAVARAQDRWRVEHGESLLITPEVIGNEDAVLTEQAQRLADAFVNSFNTTLREIDVNLDGLDLAVTEAIDPIESFAEAWGVALEEIAPPILSLQEQLAQITMSVGYELTNAFERAFSSGASGAVMLGAAIKGAIAGAIASAARMEAQFYMAKAIAAFGQGLFGDPRGFLAAAKFTAAALAFSALAGVAGGVASGGGGGSASGYRDDFNRRNNDLNDARGKATLTIVGGLLDMTDPRQAEAMRQALNDLDGRRITDITVQSER